MGSLLVSRESSYNFRDTFWFGAMKASHIPFEYCTA